VKAITTNKSHKYKTFLYFIQGGEGEGSTEERDCRSPGPGRQRIQEGRKYKELYV